MAKKIVGIKVDNKDNYYGAPATFAVVSSYNVNLLKQNNQNIGSNPTNTANLSVFVSRETYNEGKSAIMTFAVSIPHEMPDTNTIEWIYKNVIASNQSDIINPELVYE